MSIYSKNHNSQIDLKLSLHVVLIELLFLLLGDSRDVGIGVLASLEFLLDRDERVNTVDEHLDELEFRETKSVSVGDIVNLEDNKYKINPDIKINQKTLTPPSAAQSTPPAPRF